MKKSSLFLSLEVLMESAKKLNNKIESNDNVLFCGEN